MDAAFVVTIFLSVMRLSTPTFVAGMGNMFCERVGILNLGSEGMMISGAFFSVLGSYLSNNAWIGVLCGMAGGAVVALIHGVACIEFGAVQAISGLGLNMLSIGLTSFLCSAIFGSKISPNVPALNNSEWAKNIPGIGTFLFQLSPLIFVALIIVIVSYVVIFKMPVGLRIRAIGDDPKTVETSGVDVWRIKYFGVLMCGLICGLAGSYMALGQLDRFVTGMTSGKGMLAVVAVKMGRWNPLGILGTALLLGLFDAIQLQLQFVSVVKIPPELIQILPFVAGIVAISLQSNEDERPTALDMPYIRNKFKL